MTQSDDFRIAKTLDSARRGEVVLHDRKGQVMSGRRYHAHVALALTLGGLVSAGFAVAGWMLVGPPVGIVAGIASAAYLYLSRRRGQVAERALGLLARGDLDGAQAEFEQLRGTVSRSDRWAIELYLANILWLKGQGDDALVLLEPAQGKATGALRFTALFQLAQIRASTGDVNGAREALAQASDVPPSPVFAIEGMLAALLIAFHTNSVDELPDVDTLHDVGTLVLRTNRYGSVLVLLAWAFNKRGDTDLASHWLSEADSRMQYDLSRCMPQVSEWQQQQTEPRRTSE